MADLSFNLGQVVATPGVLVELARAGVHPDVLLARHLAGNCSDMAPEDQAANVAARVSGGRIFSRYTLPTGIRVWVITEGTDERGVRQSTCLLLPEEY